MDSSTSKSKTPEQLAQERHDAEHEAADKAKAAAEKAAKADDKAADD